MGKSNKIIITLSVVAFLIISLIVGLVVVFAEEQEPVVRNVNAVYKVVDADCSFSATYAYLDATSGVYLGERAFTTDGLDGDDNVLTFNNAGNKNVDTKILKPTSDIVLNKENNSVVFEFKFANSGDNAFDATLLLKNEKKSNVKVQYSEDASVWNEENIKITIDAKDGNIAGVGSYFVKVSLEDDIKDYNFSVDFTWNIIGKF